MISSILFCTEEFYKLCWFSTGEEDKSGEGVFWYGVEKLPDGTFVANHYEGGQYTENFTFFTLSDHSHHPPVVYLDESK